MTEHDDNRYDHQFEDLAGAPDDADTEIDLGDDDWQPADEQAADERAAVGAADDEARQSEAQGADSAADDDLDGQIDAALDQQAASARDRELEAMRAEIAELKAEREREASQAAAGQVDNEIAEASSRMSQAYEEGDTETAVEAQQQLIDLQVKKQMAGQQRPASQEPGEAVSNESGAAAGPPAVPEAGKRWVARNPWFAQGSHPQAAQTALVIERQLREAGYDPESDAMYTEIDKHLTRRHPDMAATPATTGRRKSRAAPTNGMGADSPASRSGKVTITAEDRRWMAQTGLDPDNPEHAKTWAREKRAEANRAARR